MQTIVCSSCQCYYCCLYLLSANKKCFSKKKVQIKIWESESGLPPNPQRGQTTFNLVYAKPFLKMMSFLSLKGLNKVDLEKENWTELSLSKEVAVAD